MLFEFESMGEVEWVLNFSQRSLMGVKFHLVNWNRSIGCLGSADRGKEVWVRNFDLPIHLWSHSILKKIGDGCGSFIELDEEPISANVLSWVKIFVRVDSKRLLQAVEMEEGSCKFSIMLWWEIPPCVGKLNGIRALTNYARIEDMHELHDVPFKTERVIRGDKQRYKDIAKNFKE